jgi:hypothetical protein
LAFDARDIISRRPKNQSENHPASRILATFGSATDSVASVGVSPTEFILRRTSPIGEQNEDIAKDWGRIFRTIPRHAAFSD